MLPLIAYLLCIYLIFKGVEIYQIGSVAQAQTPRFSFGGWVEDILCFSVREVIAASSPVV
jgi:hypothetical protein